ncbi:MAG: Wzz/FepE/Etk N-terminal domain-containing protein [Clostridia bacterium]|nr:Wzz/FepE/Etk N-terminal domain-containing protein [Clostridia bacterium]
MERTNQKSTEGKIDGYLLWEKVVRYRIWLVILLIAGIIGGFIYTKVTYVPQYASSATLFVHDTAKEISTTELSVSYRLSKDYARIIKSRTVLKTVIDELDLEGWSTNSLRRCIKTTIDEDTPRIIDLRVQTEDRELSRKIARQICVVAQKSIADIMTGEQEDISSNGHDFQIDIIDEAGKPYRLKSPLKDNMLVGFLISVGLGVLLLGITYQVDDIIKGEADVRNYLGLSVLAEIPYSEAKHSAGRDSRKNAVKPRR